MLNEKKASGYFPGMYLVYDYDAGEKAEGEDPKDYEAKVKAEKQKKFNALRKKVKDSLRDVLGNIDFIDAEDRKTAKEKEDFSMRKLMALKQRGMVSLGDDFETNEDKELIPGAAGRVVQIEKMIRGLKPDMDDKDIESKMIAVRRLFLKDSFGSSKGIGSIIFQAFKSMDEADVDWINGSNSFEDVQTPATEFQAAIEKIAGGTQPAIGRGEIYYALAPGGIQGSDSKGGDAPSTDVLNLDDKGDVKETLNNKSLSAQGATTPHVFLQELNKILEAENLTLKADSSWPDFRKFIDSIGLTDAKKLKGASFKPSTVQDLYVKTNKDEYKTFVHPKAWKYTLQLIADLMHAATTREIYNKGNKGKAFGAKHYIVIQEGEGSKFELVQLSDKDYMVSLPVEEKAGRMKYNKNGFFNLVGDPGAAISFRIPSDSDLQSFKSLPEDRSEIEIEYDDYAPGEYTPGQLKVPPKLLPDTSKAKNRELENKRRKAKQEGLRNWMRKHLASSGVKGGTWLTDDIIDIALKIAGEDKADGSKKRFDAEEFIKWRNDPLLKKFSKNIPVVLPAKAEITETKLYKLSLLEALDLK